jgi:Na+/H+-dicarboxylate symporter
VSDAPPDDRPTVPLYAFILLAMAAGLGAGPFLGPRAAQLGELGKLVIDLIKAVAAPLLLLSIVNGIAKTQVGARSGLRMLGFAMLNASLALGLGLALSNLIHPGEHLLMAVGPPDPEKLKDYASKKLDLLATLHTYVPDSLVKPFVDNTILTIVAIAVVVGLALRRARSEGIPTQAVEDGVAALLRVNELVLGWVIRLIPLAVFGVVAKTIGEFGFSPLWGLAVYVAVGVLGLFLHAFVTYTAWIVLWSRYSLRAFWQAAYEPVIYALGTNSSLATLPLTLKALDRLGVSREASTLGACVGTNFNNDGILLYEGMAVLFVAQANGIHLTLGQQVVAAGTAVIAAIGVAGVPEAGFVSLALVINTVGLPIELLPLLLTVDWVIARGRSVVNVLSDMVLSILIDGRN